MPNTNTATAHLDPPVCGLGNVQFMTNGCCEGVDDCFPLLDEHGLSVGRFNGHPYPLTDDESQLIAEDYIRLGVFSALAGYSVIYEGKKYLSLEIELGYGKSNGIGKSVENAHASHMLALGVLKRLAPELGGVVRWDGSPTVQWSDGEGVYCSALLVPFDVALSKAQDFEGWKACVEGLAANNAEYWQGL